MSGAYLGGPPLGEFPSLPFAEALTEELKRVASNAEGKETGQYRGGNAGIPRTLEGLRR